LSLQSEKRRARARENLALAFFLADRDPLWAVVALFYGVHHLLIALSQALVYAAQLPEDALALPLPKAASEQEHLADLSKRALRKAERLWAQGLTFSPEGRQELAQLAQATLERLERALTAPGHGRQGPGPGGGAAAPGAPGQAGSLPPGPPAAATAPGGEPGPRPSPTWTCSCSWRSSTRGLTGWPTWWGS
jgi:hypothetical protein